MKRSNQGQFYGCPEFKNLLSVAASSIAAIF